MSLVPFVKIPSECIFEKKMPCSCSSFSIQNISILIEALVKRNRNCACDEEKLDNLAKRDQQKSSLALGTHYGLSGCF